MAFIMEPTIILNNGGYPVAPLTTPEMVRFNDGSKLTEYIQNNNILDNSYFVRPVNQRGLATKSASGGGLFYFIDRWYVTGMPQISGSGVATLVTGGIQLSAGSSLEQNLEFPIDGDTTCSLGIVSGNASAYYYAGSGYQRFSIQNSSSTDPCVISWAKLERGTTGTPYYPKPISGELAECRRYYVPFVYNGQTFATCSLNNELYSGKTLGVAYAPPMRINPSVENIGNVRLIVHGYIQLSSAFTIETTAGILTIKTDASYTGKCVTIAGQNCGLSADL